jgi:bifunctional aspartokinase / homoserine dehydrogenase 1
MRTQTQKHFLDEISGLSGSHSEDPRNTDNNLRIMKFGGSSVADAASISTVIEIIASAARSSHLVVVVSAMSGVTNQLIEAAKLSEAGHQSSAAEILERLRAQHQNVTHSLIRSPLKRGHLIGQMQDLLDCGERLCRETSLLRKLTPRTKDSISSLGERLCAPLVAAALSERGVPSEAVEATELIITDACHGSAEPTMGPTQERCRVRLNSFLEAGTVPVVTGFIGVTPEGVLTTLGRGGSDYTATILGAALQAAEVVIWKEVDGILTADPYLVPGASTIPEISYREASELAHFGAKVLHPKTLRPLTSCGIPLSLRNTFAPDHPGTRITPMGSGNGHNAMAVTAMNDVTLITVEGPLVETRRELLEHTIAGIRAQRADVLFVSYSSSRNKICLVVASRVVQNITDELRDLLTMHLGAEADQHLKLTSAVAIVTIVGQSIPRIPGIIGRTFGALAREHIRMVAPHHSSDCSISFLIAAEDAQLALAVVHQEIVLSKGFTDTFATAASTLTPQNAVTTAAAE